VRGEGKLPSLSAFIGDVKLAVGHQVLERRNLLLDWEKAGTIEAKACSSSPS
jgi:hypothetical protein